jgi:TonB family protein
MPVSRRLLLSATILALACGDRAQSGGGARGGGVQLIGGGDRPDEHPVIVNHELPFRYPPALYARQVQGNVVLRLYIDRDGRALPESTRAEESSGQHALDSSAVRGSLELQFVPAKLRGEPVGVAVLFPVYFRHPKAPPLPGDTILQRADSTTDLP